ncbi:acyl-CoA N-acyltransferase, partial [Obelidium mucronatum]
KYIHHFRSQMEYAVVAVNVETGEIQSAIGSVGLTIDAANGMKELGYVIEKKYQGLGIMTAVVDFFVKNVVGAVVKSSPSFLSKVYAFVDPENIASWLLLERVGFVQEGFLKKHQARKGVWFDQKLYAYYF